MYARILEFVPKLEKREEFIHVIDRRIRSILKQQHGCVDTLLMFQINSDKAVVISLWKEQTYAELYERVWFPKVQEIMQPYLTAPVRVSYYMVENAQAERLERVLAN
jgi:quinol monooxygenase YgiN